jgi:hypothetical protein
MPSLLQPVVCKGRALSNKLKLKHFDPPRCFVCQANDSPNDVCRFKGMYPYPLRPAEPDSFALLECRRFEWKRVSNKAQEPQVQVSFQYPEDLVVEPIWREVYNISFTPDMITEQLEGFSCISSSITWND